MSPLPRGATTFKQRMETHYLFITRHVTRKQKGFFMTLLNFYFSPTYAAVSICSRYLSPFSRLKKILRSTTCNMRLGFPAAVEWSFTRACNPMSNGNNFNKKYIYPHSYRTFTVSVLNINSHCFSLSLQILRCLLRGNVEVTRNNCRKSKCTWAHAVLL